MENAVTKREKISYGLYFMGQNVFYGLIGYMTTYFTDIGITAALVAIVALITKVWDAINDPIIGALIDARKSTKGGRFIPWIKAFSIPMAIMCVIGFLDVSSFDYKLKLIYILVTYVLYEALYTCVNVPFFYISFFL